MFARRHACAASCWKDPPGCPKSAHAHAPRCHGRPPCHPSHQNPTAELSSAASSPEKPPPNGGAAAAAAADELAGLEARHRAREDEWRGRCAALQQQLDALTHELAAARDGAGAREATLAADFEASRGRCAELEARAGATEQRGRDADEAAAAAAQQAAALQELLRSMAREKDEVAAALGGSPHCSRCQRRMPSLVSNLHLSLIACAHL